MRLANRLGLFPLPFRYVSRAWATWASHSVRCGGSCRSEWTQSIICFEDLLGIAPDGYLGGKEGGKLDIRLSHLDVLRVAPVGRRLTEVFKRVELMAHHEHHIAVPEKRPAVTAGDGQGVILPDRSPTDSAGVNRDPGQLHKRAQFLGGVRPVNAVTRHDNGFFRLHEHADGLLDLRRIPGRRGGSGVLPFGDIPRWGAFTGASILPRILDGISTRTGPGG